MAISTEKLFLSGFALLASFIYVMSVVVISAVDNSRAQHYLFVIAAAQFFILIPCLYYVLFVRTRVVPSLSIILIINIGILVLYQYFPDKITSQLINFDDLKYYLFLAVLGLIAIIILFAIYSVRLRWKRLANFSNGYMEQFRLFSRSLLGHGGKDSLLLGYEIALWYFAIPGLMVQSYAGHRLEFSYAKTYLSSSWYITRGSALAAFVILIFYLVSQNASPYVLLVLYAAIFWLLLWVVADFRASYLSPVMLVNNQLVITRGMGWNAVVPLAVIKNVRYIELQDIEKSGSVLTLLSRHKQGCVQIDLIQAVTAYGIYGKVRSVRRLYINVDNDFRLLAELYGRMNN